LDEVIFTNRTVYDKAFSFKYNNVSKSTVRGFGKSRHVVMGVSFENGVEGFEIFIKSVNSTKFFQAI